MWPLSGNATSQSARFSSAIDSSLGLFEMGREDVFLPVGHNPVGFEAARCQLTSSAAMSCLACSSSARGTISPSEALASLSCALRAPICWAALAL